MKDSEIEEKAAEYLFNKYGVDDDHHEPSKVALAKATYLDAFKAGYEQATRDIVSDLPGYSETVHALGEYLERLPKDLGEEEILNRQRGFMKCYEFFDSSIEEVNVSLCRKGWGYE